MRYFLDTEFIEDGSTIDLLSIGIVAEDGRTLYLENSEADIGNASDWVRANVFPKMLWSPTVQHPHCAIKDKVYAFILGLDQLPRITFGTTQEPPITEYEFWAYYADYDWVVFCQLWGRMIDLPSTFPKHCMDLKQWLDENDNPPLMKLAKGDGHHALGDAMWLKKEWKRLVEGA